MSIRNIRDIVIWGTLRKTPKYVAKQWKYKTGHVRLSHENVVEKYSSKDTISWIQLIIDDQWDDADRNDTEQIQTSLIRSRMDALRRQISHPQGESRLVKIEGQDRPTPSTEESVKRSLAKKIHGHKSSKKDLQGLCWGPFLGSKIVNEDEYTFKLKEHGKLKVKVRKSDMAKVRTKARKITPLAS